MNKSAEQRFNDKVSLIYEFDKRTPLFLRVANIEIENNNVEQAVEILKEGLKNYPGYAAAHLLLGKAYILTGNYSQAMTCIKKGSELIHSPLTYEYYLNECERVKKHRSLFEATDRTSFFSDTKAESELSEPDLFIEDSKNLKGKSMEDSLEDLAREIGSARFNTTPVEKTPIDNDFHMSEERMIVSETLAKIYVAQGEFEEAIDAYKKLIKKHPDKEAYYKQKIEEIKNNFTS